MTDQSNHLRRPDYPPPLDDSPREPRGVVVTWLIALLACIAILSAGWVAHRIVPPPAPPFPAPNPGLIVMTRVAMGMDAMGLPSEQALDLSTFEQSLPTLDELRAQPDSRQRTTDLATHLHLIIIRAEFEGAEAIADRVETIATFERLPEAIAEDIAALHRLYVLAEHDQPLSPDFHERHGWFAELAQTYREDPADSPARADLIDSAKERVYALFAIAVIFALVMLAAFVLFVLAIILLATGTIRARHRVPPDESPRVNIAALESFALFCSCFAILKFISALLESANLSEHMLALAGLALLGAQWALIFIPLWPLFRGVTWPEYARALGIPRLLSIPREIVAGILGYLALLPIVALAFALSLLLTTLSGATPSHPVQQEMTSGVDLFTMLLVYALAVVWAPLAEEAIFRGLLYHHTRRFLGVIASACITGFLFAAIHPQGWTFIPVLMALGVNFALIRAWRASLVASITAHAIHNFAIVSLSFSLLA